MDVEKAEQKRMVEGIAGSDPGSDIDRKFWIAMTLFAGLAVVVWFTMGGDKVVVFGRPVELRLVPLIIIGGLAVRTVLARQAEKIRRTSS